MVQGSPAMKFYCEQCNTKYSIAEEKVRGKVLKVRCKSCGNIITVRDPEAPTPAAQDPVASSRPGPPKAPGASPRIPQTNWYYSVNGQSSAAMDLEVLKGRYETGELGDESYVWHESIIEWKPVREVDIFESALAKGHSIRPRAKTIGFTGALEAIKVTDAPKGRQAGVAPAVQRTPESRPKSLTPEPSAPVEPAEPREDRLERLREKLRNDVPKPSASLPKLALPAANVEAPKTEPAKPEPVRPSIAAKKADISNAEPTVGLKIPGLPAKPAIPSFNPQSVTSSTSNVFDAISDVDDEPSDSGLIPFFPDAPKLESSMQKSRSASQDVSASLLIRIDEMQGQNRKQKRIIIGAILFSVVVAGFALAFALTRPASAPAPLETIAKGNPYRAPVEKSYSKDKLNAFSMELGEEIIGPDERAEDLAPEPAVAEKPTEQPKVAVKAAEVKGVTASKKETGTSAAIKKPEEVKAVAVKEPALTGREALLKYSPTLRRDDSGEIKRPEDQLTTVAARPKTLSKEEARKGFKNIRQSISVCRERHMRRGATFAAKKILVAITVQPIGKVSSYKLDPAEIRLTEFDTCMTSHMERWKFTAWDGVETEINSSFVIQ
jgi:predicted Zn finger-like uncharacterized protein